MIEKLSVFGTKDFDNIALLHSELDKEDFDLLVVGGKPGIDSQVQEYALQHHIPTQVFMADYDKHARSANYFRNLEMINNSTKILFFWNQRSKSRSTYLQYSAQQSKKFRTVLY